MKVITAKSAGFCFGVQNAVDTVFRLVKENTREQIYTYGPIIHNQEVVKELASLGVIVLNSEEELRKIKEGRIVIRSHGVKKNIYNLIQEKKLHVTDATCPFVKKIHNEVAKESGKGALIIIVGNPKHPEVEGIRGWVSTESFVVENPKEAQNLPFFGDEKVFIVAQTTFNYKKFQDMVEIILEKGYDVSVLNTICNATRARQEEALSIAKKVEVMLVIGDRHSSNTQKLFEICQNACKATYYIQTLEDLNLNQLESVITVGITAGASTPNTIIEEVQSNVRIIF